MWRHFYLGVDFGVQKSIFGQAIWEYRFWGPKLFQPRNRTVTRNPCVLAVPMGAATATARILMLEYPLSTPPPSGWVTNCTGSATGLLIKNKSLNLDPSSFSCPSVGSGTI